MIVSIENGIPEEYVELAYGKQEDPKALVTRSISLSQRVMLGEKIWFENRNYDFLMGANSPFRYHAVLDQIGNVPLLVRRYMLSVGEIAHVIMHGNLLDDAPMQARVNLEYFGADVFQLEDDVPCWHWKHKSDVLSWLIGSKEAIFFPYAMMFGDQYADAPSPPSDSGMPRYDIYVPPSVSQLVAEKDFKSFVEHVHIAATCALDSPQVVTVGDADASNLIKFQNIRISPSLRGLAIMLPTGGFVFLRDAKYDLSTGGISYAGRIRISKHTLAKKIILRAAEDMAWLKHSAQILGLNYADSVVHWNNWCNTLHSSYKSS